MDIAWLAWLVDFVSLLTMCLGHFVGLTAAPLGYGILNHQNNCKVAQECTAV
jgi:hypothetical protein